ncbi:MULTISPECIES: hypothetical protein [Bacillus]|uniref:Uncharacterized protein n=3 Tax=Bacillus thuringiensis TaxID=1428 RepID=A0A1W6WL08_BACTU|nr:MULTISPECIES: hypothetical protein [Bacillus]EEM27417.1 hypothetical protein bthur0002_37660 [Bacillus thuringiensis Bt407]EEM33741.1 hypothetical protein bthur0003_37650 [Bacillus thuringiensis serovar thuringiensis str. T01001]EEM64689.1 hypothetical protein bthur0008_37180 [Bacillus thuringiensis serovar berliner ATCC 10792]MEC3200499.1 hypothetical protein [Bacillus cereus]OTW39614.1 hypothetical protein BK698_20915 [Bacillus thuringiensis serovar thuringiensis]
MKIKFEFYKKWGNLVGKKIQKHCLSILIAIGVILAGFSAYTGDWISFISFITTTIFISVSMRASIYENITKNMAAILIVVSVIKIIEIAYYFWIHDYKSVTWNLGLIGFCIYDMEQYFIEEEN